MSPERKEQFNFIDSFESVKTQIIDRLTESHQRVTTIASFEHGSLNLHENGNWSTWLKTVKQDIVVKPNAPNHILIAYLLVRDPEHYLDELKKLNRLGKFDQTDVQLVTSNGLKINLQKEFLTKLKSALAKIEEEK